MNRFRQTSAWLAAAAAVALAVPFAGMHPAAAQSLSQTNIPCPPAASQSIPPQQGQNTFIQELAQALNLSPAAVQQAISAQSTAPETVPAPSTPPPDPIASAAQQLGVTADQLAGAVRAADAMLPCSFPASPSGSGAMSAIFRMGAQLPDSAGGPTIDTTAFYASVAQNLGSGVTGQQVQSAFLAGVPTPPDLSQLQAGIQSRLDGLAAALGVSTDRLISALKSLGSSGACLPLGLVATQVTVRAVGADPAMTSYGGGPIVIPLAKAGGQDMPLSPLDQLGIKPCAIAFSSDG